MAKRQFYDWKYNTKAAVTARKQEKVAQVALERRKNRALKEADAANLSLSGITLQSDELIERYTKGKARSSRTDEPEGEQQSPDSAKHLGQETSFSQEVAEIKKSKLPKHIKGVKINELKKKYQEQLERQTEEREARIKRSDKKRSSQKKILKQSTKRGQFKLGNAATVLLSKVKKVVTNSST